MGEGVSSLIQGWVGLYLVEDLFPLHGSQYVTNITNRELLLGVKFFNPRL